MKHLFQLQKRLANWRQRFVKNEFKKKKKLSFCFVHFGPYDLFQNSPACGPNTNEIMCGETLEFYCQNLQR